MELKVTFKVGDPITYEIELPEWSHWEEKFGLSMTQVTEKSLRLVDLMYLAYRGMKRSNAGHPVPTWENWRETLASVEQGETHSPKVTQKEASGEP